MVILLALWAAVASTATLVLLIKDRYPRGGENAAQAKIEGDPAKIMREWFFGGEDS